VGYFSERPEVLGGFRSSAGGAGSLKALLDFLAATPPNQATRAARSGGRIVVKLLYLISEPTSKRIMASLKTAIRELIA
jgi:hypothetical protein